LMNFQTTQKIQKPELIDTLTDFSSKGPRSIDSLLKPEISAPGSSVISAKMGGGDKGVKMSGTSMSGPHIAGVMALLKQAHPELSTAELKSILMGHATSIKDEKGVPYLLSRQGAGRVQTYESATAQLVADRGAISLGEVNLETQRVSLEKVTIKNISTAVVQGRLALESSGALQLQNAQDLTLQPGESKQVSLKLAIDGSQLKDKISEVDGMLKITNDGRELHRIPVVAIVRKISQLKASKLKVHADSPASSAGALVEMTITNAGKNTGAALPFNLLGVDQRKLDVHNDSAMSKACDLQAVGYRVIEKTVEDRHVKVLQVGVKLYEPLTTWNACEISILIDSDGDKVPEQELAGIPLGNVKGLSAATNENQFTSVLLDAAKTRDLRRDYEKMAASKVGEKKAEENYAAAVIDELPMQPFNHSTVVVVEADVTNLAVASDGLLHFKVATIFNEASTVEMDDYLGRGPGQWQKISLEDRAQAFMDLPELVSIEPGQSITSEFTKGEGFQSLLLLYPDNRSVFSSQQTDLQSQILK
ncbi:MAG: serine protease, partial [Bdellovibrio sp. CG10_big_fil_rev_8_21_14_0_10_47_8]